MSEGRSAKTVGAIVIAGLLIAGVVVFALARDGGSPPVSPAESGLSAQAWVVPQADVVSFIEEHGGTMPNFVPNGRQPAAVVRVDWPSRDLALPFRYQVVVLDPSGQDAATLTQTEPAASWISMGWDSRYDGLGTRFPWLAATTVTPATDGTAQVEPIAVSFRPNAEGPLWIVARFPPNSAIGIARPGDTPIVGAFLTGEDERIWWASRLTPAPASP